MQRFLITIYALLAGTCAYAAVFSGVEYGTAAGEPLLLDVRMPDKPGPFPVWVEWLAPGASPLLAQDRELHAADTVLVRAVQPALHGAKAAAAFDLLRWITRSVSRYAGDRERVLLIARGDAAQSVLSLGDDRAGARPGEGPATLTGLRALVLVEPPDDLTGSRGWPQMPVLLVDRPDRAAALWRTALRLRASGVAAEPVLIRDPAQAPAELSRHLSAVMQASTVPRVQRFDQLAYDVLLTLRRPVIDSLSGARGALVLQQQRGGDDVALSIVDTGGQVRELARGAWGAQARLVRMGSATLLVTTHASGRPLIEWDDANGIWHKMQPEHPSMPVELVDVQGGAGAALLLWRERSASKSRPRVWLQRIEADGSGVPRAVALLPIIGQVRGMALASGDAVIAIERNEAGRATSQISRWSLARKRLEPLAGAPQGGWQALYGLAPPASEYVPGPDVLGLRDGRLISIDLSCTPVCVHEELDLSAAKADGAPAKSNGISASERRIALVQTPPFARWLQHPETGEMLLGLFLQEPVGGDARGGRWLIRQSSAHYALAEVPLPPGAVLRGVFGPLSGAVHGNRFVAIADVGSGSVLRTAQFQHASTRPGLWWDRSRTGHGIEFRRIGPNWQMTIYTFDDAGEPIWFRGVGDINAGRWQPDADGLLRYRRADGRGDVEIDRNSAQSIAVEFRPAEQPGVCDSASRPGADALASATLTVGEDDTVFCIEPMLLAQAGRPAVDVDGTWSAREDRSPWQLSLANQGFDPEARISALLTYFEASGAPRWAYGAADWRQGRSSIDLTSVLGSCPACEVRPLVFRRFGVLDLRARGACGQVQVLAEFKVDPATAAAGILPRSLDLLPVAPLGCY